MLVDGVCSGREVTPAGLFGGESHRSAPARCSLGFTVLAWLYDAAVRFFLLKKFTLAVSIPKCTTSYFYVVLQRLLRKSSSRLIRWFPGV